MAEASSDKPTKATSPSAKRRYLRQSDVPSVGLDEALRIPRAIVEHYAAKPTSPLFVAKALGVDPKGSKFRELTGAAIAFGLTEGGAQASSIEITDVARRIIRPTVDGDDASGKREALLKPRVFNEFLGQYDQNQLPRGDIGLNVLEQMGVARDRAQEVFDRILESARAVGLIQEINGKSYVSLGAPLAVPGDVQASVVPAADSSASEDEYAPESPVAETAAVSDAPRPLVDPERKRRVYVTHGKNRDLVEPIKKLLAFGELVPMVSVERQSVSKPVPEKVMDEMRACGAAIIHVDGEEIIADSDGHEHAFVNPNVLIEIGAAMAFYGRRFILLVREGVTLPSNLQGLYEVRYSKAGLDASATIKLLEAITDIKNHELPSAV